MAVASAIRKAIGRLGPRRVVVPATATLLVAPFLAMLASQPAAAAPGLSAQALRNSPMVRLGSAVRIPSADRAVGAVATSAAETGAMVLKPGNEAALTQFITSVTSKSSRAYHQYLTRGEFGRRFGPARSTVATVERSLTGEGLRIASVSSDGLLVTFRGSAAQVEHAFGIGLERYRLPGGKSGQATTGVPRVPAAIAPAVAGLVGLDNLAPPQSEYVIPKGSAMSHGYPAAKTTKIASVKGAPQACAEAQQAAQFSGGLTDDQIANAYGAFGMYGQGDFGQGQHIAVFEQEPFLATDIETFDTCYFGAAEAKAMAGTSGNLAGSRLSVTAVDGGEPAAAADSEDDEANLDIEDVSAIAPEAHIDVYEAPLTAYGSIDEYAAIVNADVDQVVTSSYAYCEQYLQLSEPGIQEAENFLFQQAAAQGQTVLSSAGDTGDDSCNEYRELEPPPGQNLLSLLDPASQPYVVSVGGTTIDDATRPPSEYVWNDGADGGAGGGGISESWPMPSWQQRSIVGASNTADIANAEAYETATASTSAPFTTPTFCDPAGTTAAATNCRETPDVSAQADEYTGSVTIYGQSLGYGFPDGWATIGGTSSSSPIWAAMLALVNASSACAADTINGVQDAGFASPILYGIGADPIAYAASFHDITSGNNDNFGLDNGLVFPARPGYDMASGLGSPQLTTPDNGNGLAFYMCDYAGQLHPPVVASLSRTSGPVAGGYTVTITGSGFAASGGASMIGSVQVGTGQATDISAVSGTGSAETFTATFPAASDSTPSGSPDPTQDGAGPAPVIVSLTNGVSSSPSAASMFEYVDTSGSATTPSVTSVSPYGGIEGTSSPASVTIFGSGFASGATVDFGGVAGTVDKIVSPFELVVTPPAFAALTPATACPTDNGAAGQPLSPTGDVCQVEVTVTVAGQTSATAPILPPYEGALNYDNMGSEILPASCGCEDEPQPSEYDYVPAPTVTSVSTTIADPASLAGEFGGSVVVVSGTGMDPLTFNYTTLGLPLNEDSVYYPIQLSGTSMELMAPFDLPASFNPTVEPELLPVGLDSLAGQSNTENIIYAGIPVVTRVATPSGSDGVPDTQSCPNPPPAAGCGTPLTITGSGLAQSAGPIGFVDNYYGASLGTQYTYTINSDQSISTESVQQNPALTDVEVCSTTGCSYNPPHDYLYVYPPGNPVISSISVHRGPAQGGNLLEITGTNLGCVVSVSFGTAVTREVSNAEALLACGQTGQVLLLAAPGRSGSTVRVRITTVESYFTGSKSNSVSYTYTPSAPSAPTAVAAQPGLAAATVSWRPPASDGGDPVTGYLALAQSRGTGQDSVGVTLPRTARRYTFAHLQPGVPWQFSVVAISHRGYGLHAIDPRRFTLMPGDNGYIVATANGGTFGLGSLSSRGGPGGGHLASPIAGIAATPNGLGYFEVARDGHLYHFGNAGYYGYKPVTAGQRVVGIAAAADGRGYWVLLNTGRVEGFGHVANYGSVHGITDAVAIAATPDGGGYYVAQANGKVSHFGDALFLRGKRGVHLATPIVGIAVDPAAFGYWLVGANGTVYAFGQVRTHGNAAAGAVAIVATPDGGGYWVLGRNGHVSHFGTARNAGSASAARSRAVGITTA
jgi:Pro-kumamolisin, activation domain/Fibronectin type III domain/IPT/TIG domain